MIADGDSAARLAFRAALREDTPLPIANATQELDPNDILEVRDMAAAIARAEQIVAAPRSSGAFRALSSAGSERDIFDALGERPTDDIAGPATPAPTPTPVPPAPLGPPRYLTIPSAPSAPEDDAYFQPAGRMRSLADATLEGYRPEPTLLLRARGRRKSLSWILAGVLLPVVALAAYAAFGRSDSPPVPTTSSVVTSEARLVVPTATAIPTVAATVAATVAPKTDVPVFDVKSLPSVGAPTKSRAR